LNNFFFFFRPWLAIVLALVACLLGAPAAQAQTISNSGALSFGSFVAGTGGSVVVDATGLRSRMGGVMLVPQGSAASAAQFSVTGTAGAVYGISLPANDTVALSDGNGHSMALNGFASSPAARGTLSVGGTQSLSVGATLTVGAAQAPGSYTGSFDVIVNYE
jgi:hypothetical protein